LRIAIDGGAKGELVIRRPCIERAVSGLRCSRPVSGAAQGRARRG
jgi:hypothetical protein